MKKSLTVAFALAATAIAGSASALDVSVERVLSVPGLDDIPGVPVDVVGIATFTGLGVSSNRYCQYLMEWENPFNPNDAELCVVREKRQPFGGQSCILNRLEDIASFLEAGPDAPNGSTYCAGFDNLGTLQEDVTLLLGEDPHDGLRGLAIYDGIVPLVLPIEA